MRQLSFQTDRFPTAPEGDLEHNNGAPGSEAANWLRAAVEAAGMPCKASIQEDYGWGFWLDSPCKIWVAVSFADAEPGDEGKPEWVVSVEHARPIFEPSQWFKGAQCAPIADRAFAAIENAVAGTPSLSRQE